MPLISTATIEDAAGAVREIYDQVLIRITFVPKPTQLMNASPTIAEVVIT